MNDLPSWQAAKLDGFLLWMTVCPVASREASKHLINVCNLLPLRYILVTRKLSQYRRGDMNGPTERSL